MSKHSMQQSNVVFIGGGNMAEALIAGLIRGKHKADHIWVNDVHETRLKELGKSYGIKGSSNRDKAVACADVLVLAVKPQQMTQAVQGLAPHLKSDCTVISIAAGIGSKRLAEMFDDHPVNLVRVMPNTPALVGAGMSVLCSDAVEVHKKRAEYVLAASGECAWIEDESMMHAVTAISGSGPAYFFLLAELMQAAGVSLGLPAELAAKLATQTAAGAGRMLVESGRTPAELRSQVSSPGGTTQAALDAMYEEGLPTAVRKGVLAASKRSVELG